MVREPRRGEQMKHRRIGLILALLAALATPALGQPKPAVVPYVDMPLVQLETRVDAGDLDAALELGLRYFYGDGGVAVDFAEAARWYGLAAEGGLAEAQLNLGYVFFTG